MTTFHLTFHLVSTPVSRVESGVSGQRREETGPGLLSTPLLARRSLPPAVTVSSGAEEHLLARARDLDDGAEDLAEKIAGVRARGGATALAREVLAALDTAARVLTGSMTTPPAPAWPGQPRRHATAEDFLSAVGEAEDDVAAAAGQAARLCAEILPVLAAARAALPTALAMPARTPEERSLRNAAIADTQRRIRTCDTALDILEGLRGCYREALRLLRQVPATSGGSTPPSTTCSARATTCPMRHGSVRRRRGDRMMARLAVLSSHAPGRVRMEAFPGRGHGGSVTTRKAST